jgi:hypothetical protein
LYDYDVHANRPSFLIPVSVNVYSQFTSKYS